jgi:hypothetical protein
LGFDQAVAAGLVVRSRLFTPTALEINAMTVPMIDSLEFIENSADGD